MSAGWRLSGWIWATLMLGAATPLEDQFKVSQLTTNDGLPQNTVRTITQTQDGYLWVGTWQGLADYDGQAFTPLPLHGVGGFPKDVGGSMAPAADGSLWIGMAEGFGRLAPDRTWTLEGTIKDWCLAVAVVGEDVVVGGEWGIAYGRPGALRQDRGRLVVESIQVQADAQAWLAARQGIYRLAQPLAAASPIRVLEGHQHSAIASRGPSAWASVDSDLFEVDVPTARVRRRWPGVHAEPLLADSGGRVWVFRRTPEGRPLGLGVLDAAQGVIQPFRISLVPQDEEMIRGFEDASGTLWFGTRTSGILRLRQVDADVVDERHGLPSKDVWSISASRDGGLWVQTKAGPARRVGDRFEATPWSAGPSGFSIVALTAEEALAGGRVLHRLNPKGSSVAAAGASSYDFVTVDRDGRRVAGGEGKLWSPDPTGRWSSFTTLPPPSIWIGWELGPDGEVFLGSLDRGLVRRVGEGPWQPVPLPGAPVAATVLWWEGGRRPWVGSNAGLFRRRDDGSWDRWTRREGLPEDLVLAIQPDGLGRIWLLGHHGIARVSVEDLVAVAEGRASRIRSRLIAGSEGLASTEGNSGFPASTRESDGTLWFATTRGAVRIHPDRIQSVVPPRPVIIEARDISASPDSLPIATTIPRTFAGGTGRALRLRFTAPFPTGGHRVHVEHRLEGVDRAWHPADRHREASYAGLKPGNYRFEVRAAVDDGPWSPHVARWDFEVRPLWWERVSVRLGGGAVVLAGLSVVLLRRLRLQRQLAELRQAQAIDDERRRLARDMHDGLGSELARINVAASLGPVDVGAISRDLLDRLQTLVWLTDPSEDRFDALALALATRLERFFPHGQPAVRVELPTLLPAHRIDGRWRRELVAWLDEGLANIAKHADARQVRLRIGLEAGGLTLLLADDGEGFTPGTPRVGGRGLSNLRTRVVALGGRLDVRSAPGSGTELEAWIPLTRGTGDADGAIRATAEPKGGTAS